MKAQDGVIPRFKVKIDLEACNKCGMCAVNCTFGVIEYNREDDQPVVAEWSAVFRGADYQWPCSQINKPSEYPSPWTEYRGHHHYRYRQ